jgi:hypothetical protein
MASSKDSILPTSVKDSIQKDTSPKRESYSAAELNKSRPAGVPPIPPGINFIQDIWWEATGREGPKGDPSIGVEINGVRKTYSGWVWRDWWYFTRLVHEADSPQEEDKYYWYRKRKVPSPTDPDEFIVEEEYVGPELIDLDTGKRIEVPRELQKRYRNV